MSKEKVKRTGASNRNSETAGTGESAPASMARSAKSADKRRDIALHAQAALAELGYANVNLREVAARSGITLGSIHYYFRDKTDLLIYAVSLYKDDFIRGLEELIASSNDPLELVVKTNAATVAAIEQHATTHRLWYDIRAQAMFDDAFRQVINELEDGLVNVIRHLLDKLMALGATDIPGDALSAYITMDGWFRYYLQRHLAGDAKACANLAARLEEMFSAVYASAPRVAVAGR